MINYPIEHLNVLPLTDDSFSREDMLRSKLFGNEVDRAIIGTMANEHRRRIILYDEETLIEIMIAQMKEAEPDTEVRWEDGAMWISDGLEQALEEMGEWAPVIV